MKRAFEYKDEKSHKFWLIDYQDNDFAVNYGKWGVIGEFEVKEFEDEQECIKAAEKLIASKVRKGYVEIQDFDFNDRIYIDDEEIEDHTLKRRTPTSGNILPMSCIIVVSTRKPRSEATKGAIPLPIFRRTYAKRANWILPITHDSWWRSTGI